MDHTAFLTVADVATELKVSESTVRRSIKRGALNVYRLGKSGMIRISRQQLQAFLDGRTPDTNGSTTRRPEHDAVAEGKRPGPEAPIMYQGATDQGLRWRVIHSDVIQGLRELQDASVNCITTSPPYYWQRDYEVDGQIGHEDSVQCYVRALRDAFREARRVLADDGVLFLNIGDSYYNAKGRPHGRDPKQKARQLSRRVLRAVDGPGLGFPRKSLLGIPWRVALALQGDGWVLRSSIIWQRPAPMPEPTAHDRPWRTHEPVFLFSKQPRYWFDRDALSGDEDIWRIPARPYNPGSHFAPFPLELADRCVRAGSPEGGVVLDPFVGSGTTMLMALSRGRSAIGIDLKADYCEFVRDQLENHHNLPLLGEA